MRRTIRTFLRRFGIDIIRFKKNEMGIYPFYDMSKFVKVQKPMLFDVGANLGQTVKDFKEVFRNSTIHAFEPSPETFKILKEKSSKFKDINLWNFGIGSKCENLIFNEYKLSNTSSFLKIRNIDAKNIKRRTLIETTTIDKFCEEKKIEKIDILKIDTEGFELEVMKGAKKLMANGKIGLLFLEARFIDSHDDMPSFSALWDFVISNGFELVSIYPVVHRKNMAVYTNVLFKHNNY
jgi:FkbM family methyltransferase